MGFHNIGVAGREVDMNGMEMWLAALDTKGNDLEKALQTETAQASSTPALKPLLVQQFEAQLCEDISPTESNFSSDSVFDSPCSPTNSSRILARSRRYLDTDASSLDDEDEVRARKELLSLKLSDGSNVESGSSVTLGDDSPLEATSSKSTQSLGPIVPAPAPADFDPHATHLIFLTSCLQCVLSGLPCSRTLPACSRCMRHGHGDLCLSQRKRLYCEIYCVDDSVDTNPLLLVEEGDDEHKFQDKVRLQDELLMDWREKRERKNWVLPADNGIHGDWKTTTPKKADVHPGVGSGPHKHYRLRIGVWHENAKRGNIEA